MTGTGREQPPPYQRRKELEVRNNRNLATKIILFVILFLGVIFELANHFHLTYIFVNSKLGNLMPQKWVLIISFLGAMFFVVSIVGLGVIGYKAGSWLMALLTIGVSYMSYALIPASINTDVMQVATLEYALVLPIIVAFTTHELSKFLGLKEVTTLTLEQEIQLENIRRQQEFESRKKALSPPTLPEKTETVRATTETVTPPEKKEGLLKKYGIDTDLINLNFENEQQEVTGKTETVVKNEIGFKFQNLPTETVTEKTETVVFFEKPTHGNRKQGFLVTCLHCGKEAIRHHVKAKYCSDACKEAYNKEGGKQYVD